MSSRLCSTERNPAPHPVVLSSGPLSRVPREIVRQMISFDPASAHVLLATSRALGLISRDFLAQNQDHNLLRAWSHVRRMIINQLQEQEQRYRPLQIVMGIVSGENRWEEPVSAPNPRIRVRVISEEDNSEPEGTSEGEELDEDSEVDELVQQARTWMQTATEADLAEQRNFLQEALSGMVPLPERVPEEDAAVQNVRIWMQAAANQPQIQNFSRLILGADDSLFPAANNASVSCPNLTHVPREIRLFTAVRRLNLSGNQLAFLPAGVFEGMGELRDLNLANNRLTSLPQEAFRGLSRLEFLDLSGNWLPSLHERAFDGLSALNTLVLRNNRLASFPERAFHNLAGLDLLHLSGNQLVSLPELAFHGLDRLSTLLLHNNQLVFLPERTFAARSALRSLSLQGNPGLLLTWDEVSCQGCPAHSNLNLIAFGELPFNNIEFLGEMWRFYNYESSSPLARFYQLAANQGASPEVRRALYELPPHIRNNIFWRVWREAGSHEGDPNWGENHAFDDMRIFGRALKNYVKERFNGLTTQEQIYAVEMFTHLAQSQSVAELVNLIVQFDGRGSPDEMRRALYDFPPPIRNDIFWRVWRGAGSPEGDPNWGENHVFDDMQIFGRAFQESVDSLSLGQKFAVYAFIYNLARSRTGLRLANFQPWGCSQAQDNILRLIDAMEMMRQG